MGSVLAGVLLTHACFLGEAVPAEIEPEPASFVFSSPCSSDTEFFETLMTSHGVAREQVPFSALTIVLTESPKKEYRLTLSSLDGRSRELTDSTCETLLDSAVVIVASAAQSAPRSPSPAVNDAADAKIPSVSADAPPPPLPSELADELPVMPSPPSGQRAAPSVGAGAASPSPRVAARPDVSADATPSPESAGSPGGRPAQRAPEVRAESPQRSRGPLCRLRPLLAAGGGVAWGLHPVASGFAELEGGAVCSVLGATLLGRYQTATETMTTAAYGIRLESLLFRLGATFAPLSWMRGTVGLVEGPLFGRGLGMSQPGSSVVWLNGLEAELSLRLPVSTVITVEGGVRGSVVLNSPRFQLAEGTEIFAVPRLSGGIFLHAFWLPE